MRISISNIAWDPSEDERVARLLNQHKIDAIDIAPTKYFNNPSTVEDSEIEKIKQWWLEREIQIIGMQSLLFGTQGLNIFGAPSLRVAMLSHLQSICRIASVIGAKKLVFGSPSSRDRSDIEDLQAMDIAVEFFHQLGEIAKSYDTQICLEPNPTCYGSNFMTTSIETAEVVKNISHPSIKMQIDTGSISINKENIFCILQEYSGLVGHIHISEPNLMPLHNLINHKENYRAFEYYLPEHTATIEILPPKNARFIEYIERSLVIASDAYRPTASS